ncbi:MAG: TolC family protein [Deltaproteobacteria bacterium]|nr:TolC family protein [Deltaproteobacteria bacterium]
MIVVLLALAFTAEPPTPATTTLRLSEVLAEVEQRSPALAAERARAQAQSRAADGAGFWDEPFVAVGPDELTLTEDLPVIRYQLSQVLPFPGKRSARAEAARAAAAAAGDEVSTTTRALRVVATQAFLRAVYVQKALATNALLQQAVREVQASAAVRYVSGGGGHHDALLADAELAVLERDRLLQERALRAALIELAALRGRAPDAVAAASSAGAPALEIDVAIEPPATFDDAVAAQPELAAARARIAAADAEARARGLSAWPDLTVQVMAMQSLMAMEPSNAGAMVGVALPIFAPWKQAAQADAALQGANAERAQHEALVLALRAEWEQARQDLASAEDTAALYQQKILPSTKLALESSQTAYATREAPLVEVLGVLRAYHQVALEAEAAALDITLARLRLAELLSTGAALVLAPSSPTLFGGAMGAGAMGTGAMGATGAGMRPMSATPVRMGTGMSAPAPGLLGAEQSTSGMGGM